MQRLSPYLDIQPISSTVDVTHTSMRRRPTTHSCKVNVASHVDTRIDVCAAHTCALLIAYTPPHPPPHPVRSARRSRSIIKLVAMSISNGQVRAED